MFFGLGLLALSAIGLIGGAELFTEHAAPAGRRLGVSAVAIAIVLAGAEPEELVTAIVATLRNRSGIAVGDALGVNITMLTLVLGLGALASAVPVGGRVFRYAIAASVANIIAGLLLLDGRVSRLDAGLLVACYVAFVIGVWLRERKPPEIGEVSEALEEAGSSRVATVLPVALVFAGIAIMTVSGFVAVSGAERLVDALNVEDTAVGLTFVSLATTGEMFALVAASIRHRLNELGIAAVLGSAVYNATATLGFAAFVGPLHASASAAAFFAAGLALMLLVLGGRRQLLGRPAGVFMILSYVGFVAVTLTR